MIDLYHKTSQELSKKLTRNYSTSFSLGISLLGRSIRNDIYAIYGFVRVVDEIVDTFHDTPQRELLDDFKSATQQALKTGVSTNPILHAFQLTVNRYEIPHALIDQFFHSMYMDLQDLKYDRALYEEYIVGSAEVVGLMCLCIFTDGNKEKYNTLEPTARALGAAFQKVNFLRDIRQDHHELSRTYFPQLDIANITENDLQNIYADIEADFDHALSGIRQLDNNSKFGVYLAYRYYRKLFNKIKRSPKEHILQQRIRIPDPIKYSILLRSYIRHRMKIY